MKLFSAIAVATLFATTAFAQSVKIGSPAANSAISAGSQLVVEVDKPNSLSGSDSIAIVIGLASCSASGTCDSTSLGVGTILYNGSFTPQLPTGGSGKLPHQNFTVNIGQDFSKGQAVLSVNHFSLLGAIKTPTLDSNNITVTVQ